MLTNEKVDFEGGAFQTLEADGNLLAHEFEQGMRQSSSPTNITAWLPSPTARAACVFALWQGDERRCGHRCKKHFGECPFQHVPVDLPEVTGQDGYTVVD